jgi:tRNA U34 2-thiouridine synthase MnmA/TrmU
MKILCNRIAKIEKAISGAVACGADYIITNDAAWKQFEEVKVLLVGDL